MNPATHVACSVGIIAGQIAGSMGLPTVRYVPLPPPPVPRNDADHLAAAEAKRQRKEIKRHRQIVRSEAGKHGLRLSFPNP